MVLPFVVGIVALSTFLRAPLLPWPIARHPDWLCCGHPDENVLYDLMISLRSGSDTGYYPPAFPLLVRGAVNGPVGAAALSRIAPGPLDTEQRNRARGVLTGRILSIALSGLAALLLYLLCLQAGVTPQLAALAVPLLALAPLYVVQTTYALADAAHLVCVLAAVSAFFVWDRRRTAGSEVAFGLFLGAAFAFKFAGVSIGIPPLVSMLIRSRSRMRTAAVAVASFVAGVIAFSDGFLRFVASSSIFETVIVANAQTARVTPVWNAVHYVLSLLPAMGALFSLALLAAGVSRSARVLRRRGPLVSGLVEPLPAIAFGAGLYFLGICFSSNPFTRHMLPLQAVLTLFVVVELDRAFEHRRERARSSLVLVLLSAATAYNLVVTWPVVGSFARDPLDRASEWVRAHAGRDAALPPLRNFPPVVSAGSEPGESVMIVHSAWLGRFTGSWWLKPAPRDPRDIYNYRGTVAELRFWQAIGADRAPPWRVVAGFGDDWNTPERLFLSLVGRGYDQFVTAGRAFVVTGRNVGMDDLPAAASR